jgi:hypothetical protein
MRSRRVAGNSNQILAAGSWSRGTVHSIEEVGGEASDDLGLAQEVFALVFREVHSTTQFAVLWPSNGVA